MPSAPGLFVAVGGALMGTVESLLPWSPWSTALVAAAARRHPPLPRPRPPPLLPGRRCHRGRRPRLGVAPPRDRRLHLRPPARRGAAARAERAAPAALPVQHPARDLRPGLRGPPAGRTAARAAERDAAAHAAERHAGGDHAGGGAGAASPLCGDPGGPLRRAAAGGASRSSPGVRDAMVPRLILQPLVENAIRHGITRRITPGRVDVRAWEGRRASAPRGVRRRRGTSARSLREGVGLGITRARLRQLYGNEQRVDLSIAAAAAARCARSRSRSGWRTLRYRPDDRTRDPRPHRGRRAARAGPAPDTARPPRGHAGGRRVRRRRGGGADDRPRAPGRGLPRHRDDRDQRDRRGGGTRGRAAARGRVRDRARALRAARPSTSARWTTCSSRSRRSASARRSTGCARGPPRSGAGAPTSTSSPSCASCRTRRWKSWSGFVRPRCRSASRTSSSTRRPATCGEGDGKCALRPKEYELLRALVARGGAVASRRELLGEVFGYRDDVNSRTVDTHVAVLRRKLGHRPDEPGYILTVAKAGYRLLSP